MFSRFQAIKTGIKIYKKTDPEIMRFGMFFLGFWLHLWRLFGDKISKKGSPKSDEKMDAFWESILGASGGMNVGMAAGWGAVGRDVGSFWREPGTYKIQSTPCSLPLAGGGGS